MKSQYEKIPEKEQEEIKAQQNQRKWRMIHIKAWVLFGWVILMLAVVTSSILAGMYAPSDESALVTSMTLSLFGIVVSGLLVAVPLCLSSNMDERTLGAFGILFTVFLLCAPSSSLLVVNDFYSPPNHLREWQRLHNGETWKGNIENVSKTSNYAYYQLDGVYSMDNNSFASPSFVSWETWEDIDCKLFCAVGVVGKNYRYNSSVDVWLSCMTIKGCDDSDECKDFLHLPCFGDIIAIQNTSEAFGITLNELEYKDHADGIKRSGLSTQNPLILTASTVEQRDQLVHHLFVMNATALGCLWGIIAIASAVIILLYLQLSKRNFQKEVNVKG